MEVALELQPCCGIRTGIGLYTYELAKRLASDDTMKFQGNIFNFLNRNHNEASLQGISMKISTNRTMPYGVYRRLWHFLPSSYSCFFDKTDITHFFNYIVPPRVSGKIISTIHDMGYVRFPETLDDKNLKRITKGIQSSIARSDKLVTVSEFSKREIISLLGIPEEKVVIIYPAPSLSPEMEDFQTLCRKFPIDSPYILYTGTIEPRKNISLLIKAYERLKKEVGISHKLVLVGGKGWKSDDIYQQISNSPVTEHIILTGYVSSEEKNAFYQNASVFIFPSLYEGFGMPLVEAMVHGVPVVGSNVASLPEVVGEAGLLVSPTDEIALVQAIHTILTNQNLADSFIEKGYKQAKKFTWEQSASKLKELYKGMV